MNGGTSHAEEESACKSDVFVTVMLPDSTSAEVPVLHSAETICQMKHRVANGPLGIPASKQIWMVVEQNKEATDDAKQEALEDEMTVQESGLFAGGVVLCVIEGMCYADCSPSNSMVISAFLSLRQFAVPEWEHF